MNGVRTSTISYREMPVSPWSNASSSTSAQFADQWQLYRSGCTCVTSTTRHSLRRLALKRKRKPLPRPKIPHNKQHLMLHMISIAVNVARLIVTLVAEFTGKR